MAELHRSKKQVTVYSLLILLIAFLFASLTSQDARKTPSGICFALKFNPTSNTFDVQKFYPLSKSSDQFQSTRTRDSTLIRHFAYALSGMSITWSSNGRSLYLGAPGFRDWKGTVVKYTADNYEFDDYSTWTTHYDKLDQNALFGYAIQYLAVGQRDYLIVGAPRGVPGSQPGNQKDVGRIFGASYTIEAPDKDFGTRTPEMTFVEALVGTQFEHLGASLVVVDLNGDQKKDVVVGSPFFSDVR